MGIEPGGAHHRTTEYHEPEPEGVNSPITQRIKLTWQTERQCHAGEAAHLPTPLAAPFPQDSV